MTRAQNIDRILTQIIEGENLDILIRGLTPADQNLFYDQVASLREGGDLDIEELWKVDYSRRPPTMEEFLTEPYWLGERCVPTSDNTGLFPAWKEILCRDFNLDSQINNAVLTGSLGSGKSFVCAILMCYRIAICRILRNPFGFLGLTKGTPIVFALLSVTRAAVQATIYNDVMNFMGSSPFFREECNFDPGKKYKSLVIPLGNEVVLVAGSQGQHIIGRNTLGIAMDEGNWRREKDPDMKAYQLYDEVRQRLKSRFQKVAGYLPAISLLASSARDESSFTEQVITDINNAKDDRTQKVYRLASFEVRAHLNTYLPRWFKVAFGLKTSSPRVLNGWYTSKGLPIGEVEQAQPGARTRLVPEDFMPDFRRNVTTSLQSICGESTGGAFKFFGDFSIVERAVTIGESHGLKNPCQMAQIPLSNDDQREIWHFLEPHKAFVQRQLGRYMPLRHPESPRFGHLDLATANQAGLAICHVPERKLVEGVFDPESQRIFSQYRPVIEYDFLLAIVPGEQQEISLIKIQNFFFWLRDNCGFTFKIVTADSWQSKAPLQIMSSRGFNTDVLSLDKTKDAYYAWRSAFSENLIRLFRHPILMAEAEYLLDLPQKIDHDPLRSKDLTDAAAGSAYDAMKYGLGALSVETAIPDLYTKPADITKPTIELALPNIPAPLHTFYT